MLEDDFVVDENGEGYGIGGLEDWDAQDQYSDEEEEEEEDNQEDGESGEPSKFISYGTYHRSPCRKAKEEKG